MKRELAIAAAAITTLCVLVGVLYWRYEPPRTPCPDHWIRVEGVAPDSGEYAELVAGAQRACRDLSIKTGVMPTELRGDHLVTLELVDELPCASAEGSRACARLSGEPTRAYLLPDAPLECAAHHETIHALLWEDGAVIVGGALDPTSLSSVNARHHDRMSRLGLDPYACRGRLPPTRTR